MSLSCPSSVACDAYRDKLPIVISTTTKTTNHGHAPSPVRPKMMSRQPYAPTPHSYVPNTTLSATINLDEARLPFLQANQPLLL